MDKLGWISVMIMSEQKVIIANCLSYLKSMSDESVDVCVTSPPYWALRDYGSEPVIWDTGGCEKHLFDEKGYCKCGAWKGQLGLEPSPLEYVNHLVMIFDQIKRVLKPTGSCWVNIGDTYATVSGSGFQSDKISAKKERASIESANELRKGLKQQGFKEKSLCQIPSRFAIAMIDHGWILRNEVIWKKSNVMPTSTKDRFTVDFEKFFFFVKNPVYYFKQQVESQEDSNCNAVWDIPTKGEHHTHVAMFPKSLISRPIDTCCPEGGVVLDPFCGSGTVLEYCYNHDINGIGIEINPSYEPLIKKRSKHGQTRLTFD